MRPTVYYDARLNAFVGQSMQHADGTAKGMRTVLTERGIFPQKGVLADCPNGQHNGNACCARRIISLQADFQNQKPMLQEIVESRGHHCIFLPKFHPELNFIEMYWGATKRYAREHCDYTWKGLQRCVPEALESVPLSAIRRFARKSWRYMDAYRKGLTGKQAEFTVKKYRSHRRVPQGVMEE